MAKKSEIPQHIAIVMDGNGRWAKERGLPRTAGHEAGEKVLFDIAERLVVWLLLTYNGTWNVDCEVCRWLRGLD